MALNKVLDIAGDELRARWFVCRITSSKKSVQYGIRFSYPLYILLVTLGIILVNPYILSATALIALLGVLLPMHPFDYVYNSIAKLVGINQIPGRESELQINSLVALLFNLSVIASMIFEVKLSYEVLAVIYILSSIFFIAVLLFEKD